MIPNPSSTQSPRKRADGERFSLLPSLRTLVWVFLITVLVWVWADLERTGDADVAVTFKVVPPPNSNIHVTGLDDGQGLVLFTVSGPQRKVEEFQQRLTHEPAVYEVQADRSWTVGKRRLDTVELLNEWPRIRDAGLNVHSATPPAIDVEVERWKEVQAKVFFKYTGAILAEKEIINPDKVAIRVPEKDLARIGYNPQSGAEPIIETDEINLKGDPADTKITRTVDLSTGIAGVQVDPVGAPRVDVTFRIARRLSKATVPISVDVLVPRNWLEQRLLDGYVLLRKPNPEWPRELAIEGPKEEIDKIAKDPQSIRAYVVLTDDDLRPVSWAEYTIKVDLPPGVRVDPATNLKVELRLEKPTAVTPP